MKQYHDLDTIIRMYDTVVRNVDNQASGSERAYGGVVRSSKGTLVEDMAKEIIRYAWLDLGGDEVRLSFNKHVYKLFIDESYVYNIGLTEKAQKIREKIGSFYVGIKSDVHCSIDGKLVMATECKAYTENAMFKRILVDFTLLKKLVPDRTKFFLLQLESQLGGDYSTSRLIDVVGSHSTITLISHFNVDIKIVTLLEGERDVNKPIHKPEYYKQMRREKLIDAVNAFKEVLQPYLV